MLWAARINADYPARYTTLRDTLLGSSDHDPLLARFSFFTNLAFMPLIRTSGSDEAFRVSLP